MCAEFITSKNLIDTNSRGKDRNWSVRKRKSSEMSNIMSLASEKNQDLEKRSQLMNSCADYLSYKECQTCDYKHLEHVMFCKDRFCPLCNWRRSLRTFSNNMKLYQTVQNRYENAKHYMLTLTVQNCNVEKLKDTIVLINKAWDRLSRRSIIKKSFGLGYMKVLEITRNTKNWSSWYKSMHPHLHIIASGTNDNINVEQLESQVRAEWLECLQVADTELYEHYSKFLQIELHKIENITSSDFDKNTLSHNISLNALAEVSKYTMKFNSLFLKEETKQEKSDFLAVLAEQIKGVRNISYGGEIKKIAKELRLEEKEDDLLHIDDNSEEVEFCPKCSTKLENTLYKYNRKDNDNTYRKVIKCTEIIKDDIVYLINPETAEILQEKPHILNEKQEIKTKMIINDDVIKKIKRDRIIKNLKIVQLSLFDKTDVYLDFEVFEKLRGVS